MMIKADDIRLNQTQIDGKWVSARPIKQVFIKRLKDALHVLKGSAEAVKFYKQ